MRPATRNALTARLSRYDSVVEVAVGRRPAVAGALADAGVAVTATDVRDRQVPAGVSFVRDDVTTPDPSVYKGAAAVYAINLPPELHRPLWTVANRVDAACLFTTLGAEQPAIPAEPESLPGETLYTATGGTPT